MTKRKVIRRYDRPPLNYYSWGGEFVDALKPENGMFNLNFKDTFSGKNVGTMAKGMIGGLATGIGQVGGNLIGGGLESGAGSAISKIGGTIGSAISAVNPLIGGIVSIGSGLIGGLTNRMFGSKMNEENIANVEGGIKQANSFTSDASNFDGLMTNWGAAPTIAGFDDSYIGKDGWFSNKAKKKARELRAKAKKANEFVEASLDNNAENIKDTMADNLEAHYVAYGGPLFGSGAISYELANKRLYNQELSALGKNKITAMPNSFPAIDTFALGGPMGTHGADWTNGLIFINEGGTHEANPYEGVPMGTDAQGVPNLVEEGEVVWNDYVFSNRLTVSKAIRQKYKLRKNKEITFADAAKEMQKESSERPNDPISQRGLFALMNELAGEQEKQRMKNQPHLFAFGGNILSGENPYQYGTNTLNRNNTGIDFTKLYDPSSDYMRKRQYVLDNWDTDEIQSWLKNAYIPHVEKYNKSRGYTDPFTVTREQFEKGTMDKSYGGMHTGVDSIVLGPQMSKEDIDDIVFGRNTRVATPTLMDIPLETEKEIIEEEAMPMKTNPFKYASIFGAGTAVLNDMLGGNNPNYENANRFEQAINGSYSPTEFRSIGNYLRYTPLDREFYTNILRSRQGATRRAIANTSGGNRANAVAGLLATDFNAGNELGNLIREAETYNRGQEQTIENFNRATNMFNSEGFLKADTTNATNRAQQGRLYGTLAAMRQDIYDRNRAEKAANLTNLFQGLSDLGTELTDRDKIRWLIEKGVLKFGEGGKKKTRKRGLTI